MLTIRLAVAASATLAALSAVAHPGHENPLKNHPVNQQVESTSRADDTAVTGQGNLRFRYRADLSELPEPIARGIQAAHGGFAKGPDGEVYFGLEGVGLVRISADLTQKTLLSDAPALREGGMHNTTYLPRDGGVLVLPDNARGEVHVYRLSDGDVRTAGRPAVNEYYTRLENPYAPTDTEIGRNGVLYVCDGYSPGNYVLKLDLDQLTYLPDHFGGRAEKGRQTPGKFSTNHGVTRDPERDALWIADRGNRWAQLLTPEGEFIRGIDMRSALVCDIDFVDWREDRVMVAGCLRDRGGQPGIVHLLVDEQIVSTLRPKLDLGLDQFDHVHNAVGVEVEGKLFVLCYGWNPGAYAVLECVD